MQGLTAKSIAKNPSLIPVYACVLVGMIGAGGYLIRLATKNPDVTWNSKKNMIPNNDYTDKEYKLWTSEAFKKADKVQIPKY